MSSVLTLHTYHFPVVQVVANTDIPEAASRNKTQYNIDVGLSKAEQEGVYQLSIEITSQQPPKEAENKDAYNIHLIAWGEFSVSPEWDTPEKLVRINGASILYSAAREFLITVTSRGPWGAITLPTVSFNQPTNEEKQSEGESQNTDI